MPDIHNRVLRNVALLLSCLAWGVGAGDLQAQRPNILLVVADDLGVDEVRAYGEGGRPAPTPTLDALVRDGVLFRNAWANPTCSPTRSAIQTGRHAFRHGVGTALPFARPLSQDETTIPEALTNGASGYRHAAIGKWHLGGNPSTQLGRLDPNLQGYDHFSGTIAGAFVQPFDYETWPKIVDGELTISTEYATTVVVDDALRWIAGQTEPWFCYLAFHAPHTPFHAPPAELHGQDLPGGLPCRNPRPFYEAMVEAMDTELGRLLASLDPAVRSDTLVIVIGDNGTTGAVVQSPFDSDRAKGTLYQGGVRVPLIVSGTGIRAPGRESTALVHAVDLFATVLELAGVNPASAVPQDTALDSVSIVPHLQRPNRVPLRQTVFTEGFIGRDGRVPIPSVVQPPGNGGCLLAGAFQTEAKAIRNAFGFKLIRYDAGRQELFDLRTDPFETTNLYRPLRGPSDPVARANYVALSAAMDALLESR